MHRHDIRRMLLLHMWADAHCSHHLYAAAVHDAPPGCYAHPNLLQIDGVFPMLVTILLVILILALIGGLPRWGYSRSWGYGPSGGLGLIVVILIVLLLLGRI
jgi:hypothetical protein